MPELPEVEAVRRLVERAFLHQKIEQVDVEPDGIVFEGKEPHEIQAALAGRKVEAVCRKGKFWWLEFAESPTVILHLGMSGWVRDLGADQERRLVNHGKAPLEEEGRPRFLKLLMTSESGRRIAFTDGRRLARIWLCQSAQQDERIQRLGRDMFTEPYTQTELSTILSKRSAPMKALLLDQRIFAGVGNWVADEVLYQAGIAPQRMAKSLVGEEVEKLQQTLASVLNHAVSVEADDKLYPDHWLFHYRWGGSKGRNELNGNQILRETVGGRTTAWIPSLQR
ncbi:MAG: hypothetical protein MUC92_09545 [Fimbriimonadaceae bacterium]|jgi:formamidopyrimidine-DNA glycosylase|nr:hypothetical protein [Fimbriimonadaceae bacterium]